VVEDVNWDGEGDLVIDVRVSRRRRSRCGICGRRCPGYDGGKGRRRWRGLDLGASRVFIAADAPRVACVDHGVVVAAVPWARHGSDFTRQFEEQTAWLAVHCAKSHVVELMRIAWRTVGNIVTRVKEEALERVDLLANLRRIGIDEISHRKGQKYITVVIDHDSGRLVWAKPGRDAATVEQFFADLGPERSKSLEFVSADGAAWIETAVRKHCPNATLCLDAFHVVCWATDALDEVRRDVWNEARRAGMTEHARELKDSRYALWKNPDKLTARQQRKLSLIAKTNQPLYRAYLLKEQLRTLLKQPHAEGMALLERWLAWASRSRLPPFVKLARNLRARVDQISTLLRHRLSNARTEALNTRLRLIHRRAFGFHLPDAMISLAMLALGGLCPPLPGRS
jgi:transposase